MSKTENASHELAPEFTEENSHVLSSYKEELRVELTQADVRRYHSEAADLELDADQKFLQAKDAFDKAKSKWKGDTTRAKEMRQSAHRGWITRTGTVEVVAHWQTDTAYSVRRDSGYDGVVIESRPLVDGERQQLLPLPNPKRSKDWWASFGQEVIRHMAEAKADGEELTADGTHSLILASEKYQDSTVAEVQQAMDKVEADSRAMLEARENGDDGVVVTDEVVKSWPVEPAEVEALTETQIRDLVVAFLLESGKSGPKKIANHVRESAPEVTDKAVKAALLAEIDAGRVVKSGRSSYSAALAAESRQVARTPIGEPEALDRCVELLRPANNGLSVNKLAKSLADDHVQEDGSEFTHHDVKAWLETALSEKSIEGLDRLSAMTFMIRK